MTRLECNRRGRESRYERLFSKVEETKNLYLSVKPPTTARSPLMVPGSDFCGYVRSSNN